MKFYLGRRSLLSPPSSKLQCDYLQYTSVPPQPPGSPPSSKPYYSSTVARGELSGTLDSDGLYYTLQPVYSSSSGSASSDPACLTSSHSSPVPYGQYSQPSPIQYSSGPPATPQLYSLHSSPLHVVHMVHEPGVPYEGPGGGGLGTQKKRTLVKYRYPDILPSDNTNQNYYV